MDRNLEDQLAVADRHVVDGERLVARQRYLIAGLRPGGRRESQQGHSDGSNVRSRYRASADLIAGPASRPERLARPHVA